MRRALLIFLTAVVAMAQQPGAEPYGPALQQQLAAAWSKRPADYRPRTRHLSETGEARYTNRLFLESSPYLLQHAHNPVDWRPWSDEAFELARELGRPVLLSIGYSTCHWCHVMEEESFEDEEIARFINEHYIAIKVDREQRPDIDGVYLAALHAMTGAGGWPMTLWLTPDREPFFAGTYFPPRDGDRGIATGFLTLLDRMQEIYLEQPDAVAHNSSIAAERVTLLLSQTQAGGGPSEAALTAAVSSYKELFDAANGGVQGSPKFPSGLPVRLLLDEYAATKDESLLSMAAATLTGMSQGGIRDHLHGGFHRYATDARWRVPHFEKMLYDNALLASVYIEGRRATGDTAYEAVIRDILRFLAEEMTAPGGGFYSATDADSLNPETAEREEGFYFTWTPEELEQALGPEDAAIASAVWSITDEGDLDGRNILRRNRSPADVARELKLTEGVVAERIPGIERRMRAAREGRPKPLRDDKILAAWNGYAISAFAEAAFALEEPGYADSARRAARFLLDHMRVDGRLQRSYFGGAVSGEGYLDDYAAVIAGLISLYEVTAEVEWLQGAIELDRVLAERFAAPSGGYYLTGADHEKLIVRQQVAYDEAEPSGNSVQALNLLRLHEITTDDAYRECADKLLAAFSSTLNKSPADLSEMLRAVRWRLSKPKQLVFVGPTVEQARRLASEMRWSHAPQSVMVIAAESDVDSLSATIPLLAGKRAIAGQATAYVCEERVCKLPTSDPAKLRELVAE